MQPAQRKHTALSKLTAVLLVYQHSLTVSEVSAGFGISRSTWYEWEKQLKDAIQPVWGGLSRHN
jgi:transposase-like protein